jgi:hypothetical protein
MMPLQRESHPRVTTFDNRTSEKPPVRCRHWLSAVITRCQNKSQEEIAISAPTSLSAVITQNWCGFQRISADTNVGGDNPELVRVSGEKNPKTVGVCLNADENLFLLDIVFFLSFLYVDPHQMPLITADNAVGGESWKPAWPADYHRRHDLSALSAVKRAN